MKNKLHIISHTHWDREWYMSFESHRARLVELMATAPAQRFGTGEGIIRNGGDADLCVYDLDREYTVDPDTFVSKGRSTPFK